jgi:hypothetical protein
MVEAEDVDARPGGIPLDGSIPKVARALLDAENSQSLGKGRSDSKSGMGSRSALGSMGGKASPTAGGGMSSSATPGKGSQSKRKSSNPSKVVDKKRQRNLKFTEAKVEGGKKSPNVSGSKASSSLAGNFSATGMDDGNDGVGFSSVLTSKASSQGQTSIIPQSSLPLNTPRDKQGMSEVDSSIASNVSQLAGMQPITRFFASNVSGRDSKRVKDKEDSLRGGGTMQTEIAMTRAHTMIGSADRSVKTRMD